MKYGPKIIVEVTRSAGDAVDVEPHGQSRTSSISSGVTSHGPAGSKVSADLPFDHCPPRSIWKARSLTSLTTV